MSGRTSYEASLSLTVDLINDFVGAADNQPITEAVSHPDFMVEGMSGGLDPTT